MMGGEYWRVDDASCLVGSARLNCTRVLRGGGVWGAVVGLGVYIFTFALVATVGGCWFRRLIILVLNTSLLAVGSHRKSCYVM